VRRPVARRVAMAALVLVAGCALVRRPAEVGVPATARALLGALEARRAATTSLRARARLKAGLAGMWTRQAVLVRRPADVRIDVLSPFGLALALGTGSERLWIFPPAEGVRFEGSPSPEMIARFLGVPVAVEDLVDILLGLPPLRAPTGVPTATVTAEGELEVVVPLADGYQTLWFAPGSGELRRAEERRTGGVALRLGFGDYRDGFPWALEVAAPELGRGATLAYDAVERNVDLDATLFAPPPAPRVLPLEAAAGS